MSIQQLPAHSQVSQIIGIDTTQSLGNFDYIFQTVELPNGNVWMAARCERTLTSSGGQVSNYGTFVQMTSTGQIISSKKSGFRSVNTMALASDGNLVMGGEGSGFFCTSGMCKSDMLVAKISTNNTYVWGRSFGNPNYNGSDGFKRVFETADSNIVAVGNIYQSSLNSHPFIAKLNGATGDTLWTRAFTYPSNQFGNDASEGPNGELFLGVTGDLRIIKLTAAGMVEWSEGFANYGEVMRVFAQNDGSVIAAGHYMVATGNYNTCLFKVGSTGTLEWFRDYDTQLPDHYELINDAVFLNGNIYFAGFQYSNVNFTGMYPWVFKTDSLGNIAWSITHPSPVGEAKCLMQQGNDLLCGIDYSPGVVNNRPDILLTQVNMDHGGNTCMVAHPIAVANPVISTFPNGTGYYTDYETQVTTIGISNQNYWRSTTCLSTGMDDMNSVEPFSIIQHNELLIIHPHSQEPFSLELFDIAGKRLHHAEKISGDFSLDVGSMPNQVILVRIFSGSNVYVEKIIAK